VRINVNNADLSGRKRAMGSYVECGVCNGIGGQPFHFRALNFPIEFRKNFGRNSTRKEYRREADAGSVKRCRDFRRFCFNSDSQFEAVPITGDENLDNRGTQGHPSEKLYNSRL